MTKKLLPLIPPHFTYVEAFGGGASLLFAKQPSPVEVYNDMNSGLVNLFRVIRDKDMFDQFHQMCIATPFSREEYKWCQTNWTLLTDPIKKAWAFYVVARMSFGGLFDGGWSIKSTSSNSKMAASTQGFMNAVDGLPQIHNRLMRVIIDHKPALDVIDYYDSKSTFFYLDPPYVWETRSGGGGYKHEMDRQQHIQLVKHMLGIDGMCVISGYKSELYDELVHSGWQTVEWDITCTSGNKLETSKQKKDATRTEVVWINPRAQELLRLKQVMAQGK